MRTPTHALFLAPFALLGRREYVFCEVENMIVFTRSAEVALPPGIPVVCAAIEQAVNQFHKENNWTLASLTNAVRINPQDAQGMYNPTALSFFIGRYTIIQSSEVVQGKVEIGSCVDVAD